jgi:transposase
MSPYFARPGTGDTDMKTSEVFVGIDISSLELEIGLLPQSQTWKSPNDETGMSELIERLAELGPTLVVMEATGGLERPVHTILEEAGLAVRVVNPRQVRDFAKALGILAKTDAIDALVLAKYAQSLKPEPRPAKDKQTRELEALLKRHCQLVDMLTQERNRLRTTPKSVRGNLEAHIAVLKKYLNDVDKETRSFIKRMPIWKEKDEIIRSVPGAGPVLSVTVLSSVPEMGALNRRKIGALIGVVPFNCDSGKFKGRRRCWGGRADVRSILYMATLAAIRCNVIIRPFYQRLIAAGKDKKVAITACMRKFLTILNTMLRNGTKWNPVLATGH